MKLVRQDDRKAPEIMKRDCWLISDEEIHLIETILITWIARPRKRVLAG
jgi:hypothetical protein